jgi:hypothetical protein
VQDNNLFIFFLFNKHRLVGSGTLGSIGLGAFIGFLITVVMGILFPGAGYIIGGFLGGIVAGLIARSALGGVFAGFLSGIGGAVILVILALIGSIISFQSDWGFFGALVSGIADVALSIIVAVVVAVVSIIGGFIGGFLSRG